MIYRDKTDKTFNWVLDNLKDKEHYINDLTLAIKNDINELVAGVIYSRDRDITYLTIYAANPSWCTRKNLSTIFKIPFEVFDSKIVKCVTSHKNKKVNRLLWGLKLKEEGHIRFDRVDGSHSKIFSLTKKELKTKKWYKEA